MMLGRQVGIKKTNILNFLVLLTNDYQLALTYYPMSDVLTQLLELRKQDLESAKEFRDEIRTHLKDQDATLKDQNKTLNEIYTQTKITNGRVNKLDDYKDKVVLIVDTIKKSFWRVVVGVAIVVIGAYAVGHFIHV